MPEIADKLVEIVGVAREPGYRSKIAVVSHADGVDPVGACVGPRGSRVRMVVSELRGEKIDIIPHNDEPARFVAKALSPARVREVLVDDEDKQATVIVPDDQLSLAIGRDGQNARLAARLTGWRVDIKSETEFAQEEDEIEYEGEEEFDGRCMAVLSNGRRCPNAASPARPIAACRSTRRWRASRPARWRSSAALCRGGGRDARRPRRRRGDGRRDRRAGRGASSTRRRRGRGGRRRLDGRAAEPEAEEACRRLRPRRHRRAGGCRGRRRPAGGGRGRARPKRPESRRSRDAEPEARAGRGARGRGRRPEEAAEERPTRRRS